MTNLKPTMNESSSDVPRLTSLGHELDLSDGAFGWFRDSRALLDDPPRLRSRFEEDGYLFLVDFLERERVAGARERLLEQLHELSMLQPGTSVSDGIACTPWQSRSCHALIEGNPGLQQLLYSGRMLDLFNMLLEFEVRHFDFTWIRTIGPGQGTAPHADAVYMNRGTPRLLTAWTPLMEIPLEIGGLMIMPGSHRLDRLRKYFAADVDTYCENQRPRTPQDSHGWIGPMGDGKLSENPAILQQRLRLPWLTARVFRPGDVVIFGIHTLHGSLDNHSRHVRLSTDSRYQRSDEPADPRWIGPNPSGHAPSNRRALIC